MVKLCICHSANPKDSSKLCPATSGESKHRAARTCVTAPDTQLGTFFRSKPSANLLVQLFNPALSLVEAGEAVLLGLMSVTQLSSEKPLLRMKSYSDGRHTMAELGCANVQTYTYAHRHQGSFAF